MMEKKKEQKRKSLLNRDIMKDSEVSKSRKGVEIFNRVLDWATWIVIAVVIYYWVKSGVWQSLDCSVEQCMSLYNGVCTFDSGQLQSVDFGNLSNLKGGTYGS